MCVNKVQSFCGAFVPGNSRVLVATSGGSDSTALACILAELKDAVALDTIGIAHVNHGLRGGESDRDEEFVEQLASELGFAFYAKRLEGLLLDSPALEETARRERYAFFHAIQAEHGYTHVATGHTADDQAETVIMRLLRGCGLNGMRGILPIREDGVIRPVLGVRREGLQNYLRSHGRSWREDKSNQDEKFVRNWVRHSIIPLLERQSPIVVERLCQFAQLAQRIESELAPIINKWLSHNVIREDEELLVVQQWLSDEDDLAAEALARLFRQRDVTLSRKHIETILKNSSHVSKQFLLPGGWCFLPGRNALEFMRGVRQEDEVAPCEVRFHVPGIVDSVDMACSIETSLCPLEKDGDVSFDSGNWRVCLDADNAGKDLVLRNVTKDDKVLPLGAESSRNAIRYLKNQGIQGRKRCRQVVVTDSEGEVLWIPGVGIGRRCRVTKQTKVALKLYYQSH